MSRANSPTVLLYIAAEDRAFMSHRLPMARAARDAGFDVHIATQITEYGHAIRNEGFTLHDIPFRRGGMSPVLALKTVLAVWRTEQRIDPAIIHHSGLQCCIVGGLAAVGRNAPQINALTGLGYTFTSRSINARILKIGISIILGALLNRSNSIALVQNADDGAALEAIGIRSENVTLIPGSGVDTDTLEPLPEPEGPVTVGFAGRLLRDKGIRALISAHRLLQERGLDTRLLIAGEPDIANPESVSLAEAKTWNQERGITWLGHVSDIKNLWSHCHIAALPSHREGLPKSLLEAAAFGRPMVATDVPGCREIAIHEQTGLLVPVENPSALAEAIAKLASNKELRKIYGDRARRLVVEKLSSRVIGSATVELYRRQLRRAAA